MDERDALVMELRELERLTAGNMSQLRTLDAALQSARRSAVFTESVVCAATEAALEEWGSDDGAIAFLRVVQAG